MKRRFVIVMVVIFVVLSVAFILLRMYAPQYHTGVLQTGNIIMLGLSLAAYVLVNKQIADRPQAFVRGVYSASLLRLMVCMGAMLAYIVINKNTLHKPSVFILLGIYSVYSAAETILLSKTAKKEKK